MSTKNRMQNEPGRNQIGSHGFGMLSAIILAILAGGVFGVLYGEPMWIAAGGPHKEIERLEIIKQQKQAAPELIESRANGAEDEKQALELHKQAERLRDRLSTQLERIDQRIDRVSGKDRQPDLLASVVWDLTEFVGDLFLQVLKLLVIPLVVTSMVCGITSLGDIRKVGRIGIWTIVYYMSTGAIAVLIGIFLVVVIQPGKTTDDTFAYKSEKVTEKEDATVLSTLLDVFRGSDKRPGSGMFPSNLFQAASNTNVLALIVFSEAVRASGAVHMGKSSSTSLWLPTKRL